MTENPTSHFYNGPMKEVQMTNPKVCERYPANPFIAEVCEHYPARLSIGERNARAWLGSLNRGAANDDCRCGDCFYCDGD